MLAAGLTVFSCKDKYDLDTEQPSGLNSIYGYLSEQGNYTNYLRLINDLGQSEILSKTGSKTMFAADDAAFMQFFAGVNNPWGVKSYEQLTPAQKKLLLYSSMIDNPYTSTMLSTATGPVKGEVCRRISSLTIQDSVPVFDANSPELPDNKFFNELKATREKIVLYCDASAASPMVHFTSKFISTNMIQPSDINFLYNSHHTGAAPFQSKDVFVNNARVTEADIFCKNGFIHKVDQVVVPLDNMAEIIRKNPNTQMYSSIIERFAAPFYDETLTKNYNQNYGTNVDSVFQKRYFSKASQGSGEASGKALDRDRHGNIFSSTALLKFDPGWNGYYPQAKSKGGNGLLEDMGVMIVPTDAAMEAYFAGPGVDLIGNYGKLENIPTDMLYPLVNVNMQPSFVTSVPSKFGEVLDDANEPMNITKEDIVHVQIGSNGVVYFTNKVFAPKSYSSVLFPILVNEKYRVVRKAIEELAYDSYLNSTAASYSFIIPSPDANFTYVDPVSFATGQPRIWDFVWDEKSSNFYARIYNAKFNGDRWEPDGESIANVGYDNSTNRAYGVGTTSVSGTTISHVWGGDNENSKNLNNRFVDILDNIICVEEAHPGKQYYRTKGNSFVRIADEGRAIQGSGQAAWGENISITEPVVPKTNGKAYIVDGVIMGSNLSVCGQLAAHKELFSDFYQLIQDAGAVNLTNPTDKWTAADAEHGNLLNIKEYEKVGAEKRPTGVDPNAQTTTTYFTNNYHYTVYAPTNEAMKKAYEAGLPTHQDLMDAIIWDRDMNEIYAQEAAAAGEAQTKFSVRADTLREIMLDFFKYHMHDNAVFVDEGTPMTYTSNKVRMLPAYSAAEGGKYTVVDDWHIDVDGQIYETRVNIAGIDPTEVTVEYITGRYTPGRAYEITANPTPTGMTLVDATGRTVNVVKDERYRNIMAREVWITGLDIVKKLPEELLINNASTVVVHGIDEPLYFGTPDEMFHYTYKELAEKQRK